MKQIVIAISMMIIAIFMFAQTTVPAGPVQGSWDETGSPYLVTGNINVPNNAALSIGPRIICTSAGGTPVLS